tara:strand:+ start:246 stop:1118 length:873 start_codon:yes stop_codon:yes gene_type:complete
MCSDLNMQAKKHAWSFRTITILIGVAAAFCAVLIPVEEVDRPSFRGVAYPPQWMPVFLATGALPVQSSDPSGPTTTPSPEKVSADARLSNENVGSPLSRMSNSANLRQIELIVNERPAVAVMHLVVAEKPTTLYLPTVSDAEPLGPFLLVMLTYKGNTPAKNEDEIRNEFFGDTGYADLINEASWGQYELRSSDVDFITIDSGDTDPINFGLGATSNLVTAHQTYKNKIITQGQDYYTRTLIFEPDQPACGSCFRGTAYTPGTFSHYRGKYGQDWQTIVHELGHNDGLEQ